MHHPPHRTCVHVHNNPPPTHLYERAVQPLARTHSGSAAAHSQPLSPAVAPPSDAMARLAVGFCELGVPVGWGGGAAWYPIAVRYAVGQRPSSPKKSRRPPRMMEVKGTGTLWVWVCLPLASRRWVFESSKLTHRQPLVGRSNSRTASRRGQHSLLNQRSKAVDSSNRFPIAAWRIRIRSRAVRGCCDIHPRTLNAPPSHYKTTGRSSSSSSSSWTAGQAIQSTQE